MYHWSLVFTQIIFHGIRWNPIYMVPAVLQHRYPKFTETFSDWWFQTFCMFHSIWDVIFPLTNSYVSKWLKPPTSFFTHHIASNLNGGLEHFFIFPYIEKFIIPTDELIFFRGVGLNHQPEMVRFDIPSFVNETHFLYGRWFTLSLCTMFIRTLW